jgi:hypothetical protein
MERDLFAVVRQSSLRRSALLLTRERTPVNGHELKRKVSSVTKV